MFSAVCLVKIQIKSIFIFFPPFKLLGGSLAIFAEINLFCIAGEDKSAITGIIKICFVKVCQRDFSSLIIWAADPPGRNIERRDCPGKIGELSHIDGFLGDSASQGGLRFRNYRTFRIFQIFWQSFPGKEHGQEIIGGRGLVLSV